MEKEIIVKLNHFLFFTNHSDKFRISLSNRAISWNGWDV